MSNPADGKQDASAQTYLRTRARRDRRAPPPYEQFAGLGVEEPISSLRRARRRPCPAPRPTRNIVRREPNGEEIGESYSTCTLLNCLHCIFDLEQVPIGRENGEGLTENDEDARLR